MALAEDCGILLDICRGTDPGIVAGTMAAGELVVRARELGAGGNSERNTGDLWGRRGAGFLVHVRNDAMD